MPASSKPARARSAKPPDADASVAFLKRAGFQERFLPEGVKIDPGELEPKPTTLGDEEPYTIDYDGSVGGKALHSQVVMTARDGRGYTPTYVAPRDDFEVQVGEFESLLDSWTWTSE